MSQAFTHQDLDLPLVCRLAKQLNQHLVFLDLETTTNIVNSPQFGVTEIAYFVATPKGTQQTFVQLVDPENEISPIASQLTGITQEMVTGKPNFSTHKDRILSIFNSAIVFTYNGDVFDVPGTFNQLERYGHPLPTNCQSVDLYKAWKKIQNVRGGKLVEVAKHYGVAFDGAHRALADVYGLANVLEQMLWQHGSNFVVEMAALKYDPSNPESKKEMSSTLTLTQKTLKSLIDDLTATEQSHSVLSFSEKLLEAGYQLEVSKTGAAYIHIKSSERTGGSVLGATYVWSKIQTKLSGEVPSHLLKSSSSASSSGSKSSSGSSVPSYSDRKQEESVAKETLITMYNEMGKIDLTQALEKSQLKTMIPLSMALGSLLSDGIIPPEAAHIDDAQQWLEPKIERFLKGTPDRRLKPLLLAIQKENCPASIDYVQLRIALLRFDQKQNQTPENNSSETPLSPSANQASNTPSSGTLVAGDLAEPAPLNHSDPEIRQMPSFFKR